jgi:hypothetical protein
VGFKGTPGGRGLQPPILDRLLLLCEALRASIPPEFRALARFSVPEAAEIKAEITNLATKLRQIVRLK